MVNEKMTAIADKIRTLLGLTGKMGLDAMATNLETEKTNISAAYSTVKNKGGTVPASPTSGNLASAIESISVGPTVQIKSGTVTGVSGVAKTVNCGFKPDAVFFTGTNPADNYATTHAGVSFTEAKITSAKTIFAPANTSYVLSVFTVAQTSTGFSVKGMGLSNSLQPSEESNRSLSYIAIKYT